MLVRRLAQRITLYAGRRRQSRGREPKNSLFHHDVIIGQEFVAFIAEDTEVAQSPFLHAELQRSGQYSKSVFHATPETDARSFREITRWAGDFSHAIAEENNLRQHLIVKCKIVSVGLKRQRIEDCSRESAVTGVIFGEFVLHEQILNES